jgi:hypothetical protein
MSKPTPRPTGDITGDTSIVQARLARLAELRDQEPRPALAAWVQGCRKAATGLARRMATRRDPAPHVWPFV